MKLAINGFGRIGRQALKIALEKGIEVIAVNDLSRADELAHLLKFDTVYGTYEKEVKAIINRKEFTAGDSKLLDIESIEQGTDSTLIVDGRTVKVFNQKDPAQLPWGELEIDVVLECTGVFTKDNASRAHIEAGAKRVVISAPSKGNTPAPTFVIGANSEQLAGEEVISNASCTTNCVSPVMKIMHEKFGVVKAIMTTIHAYTSTQNIVDGSNKDLRRGRAAALNMIPTTTGAAAATAKALPVLENKFDGAAIRVPIIAGSISDITLLLEKQTTVKEVNNAFLEASKQDSYRGILAASETPLVSSDVIGRTESAIVDLPMTKVVDGNLVKVMAWYDNEWGYSFRLVEMSQKVMMS